MTLGTAASISIAMVIGWRIRMGASSVRKSAVATPRGTAIRRARSDDTSVPKMKGSAPYFSATGSHSELQRNPAPNLERDSRDPA